MPSIFSFRTIAGRDRLFITGGIIAITVLSWAYMFYLVLEMNSMNMTIHECVHECCKIAGMPMSSKWTGIDFLLMSVMWAVMMVAMMLPSVSPLILMYAAVNRKKQAMNAPYIPVAFFTAGYFIVWTVFSVGATVLQWALQYASLLSPLMVTNSKWIGGSILLLAGLFQFSRLKFTCLAHCRSPLDFIMHHWKNGKGGAIKMGISHGLYCLGCCWILMLVLFATGIMNLIWVAAIALFVLFEKLIPGNVLQFSRVAGSLLVAYGLWVFWM